MSALTEYKIGDEAAALDFKVGLYVCYIYVYNIYVCTSTFEVVYIHIYYLCICICICLARLEVPQPLCTGSHIQAHQPAQVRLCPAWKCVLLHYVSQLTSRHTNPITSPSASLSLSPISLCHSARSRR